MDTMNHMTVMNIFSGAIYTVVRDSQKFLFMKIGGEIRGVTVEDLPEPKMYSEPVLREMGIRYFYLYREELSGYIYNEKTSVSTNWNNCGTLRLCGKKKKTYVILDSLEPSQIAKFMAGVPDITPDRVIIRNRRVQAQTKSEKSWLEVEQDPERMKKLKVFSRIFFLCCYATAALFLFVARPYKLFSILCLIGIFACLSLGIRFPAYFSMLESEKDAVKRGVKPRIFVGMPFMMLMTTAMLRTVIDFSYISWTGMIIWTGIVGGAIALILGLHLEERKNRKLDFRALVLLVLFWSMGIVGQINYLTDFSKPSIYYTEVVDQHVSHGKTTSYYCTVLLENGEEFDIQVNREMYQRNGTGNWVKTQTYSGGLGIAYIEIVP